MNTATMNEVAIHQSALAKIVRENAKLEKARFTELLDETFALAERDQPEHRVPSFYPNYHRVRVSVNDSQSYVSDASVTLKLKADRYTLSIT